MVMNVKALKLELKPSHICGMWEPLLSFDPTGLRKKKGLVVLLKRKNTRKRYECKYLGSKTSSTIINWVFLSSDLTSGLGILISKMRISQPNKVAEGSMQKPGGIFFTLSSNNLIRRDQKMKKPVAIKIKTHK